MKKLLVILFVLFSLSAFAGESKKQVPSPTVPAPVPAPIVYGLPGPGTPVSPH